MNAESINKNGEATPLTVFTEDEQLFQSSIRDFAEEQVRPCVSKMDHEAKIDPALIRGFFELGLMGVEVPENYGGAGGTRIQAWIVKPPDFDASRKYPLLVLVHGGPEGAWTDGWTYRWNAEVLASAGYVVFMPNPRGSTGFGQKFVERADVFVQVL